MTALHLAQVNIARIRASLEDPQMADFVARLDEINALAERSPGFVWRVKGEANNATYRSSSSGSTSIPARTAFTFKQPFPADADLRPRIGSPVRLL